MNEPPLQRLRMENERLQCEVNALQAITERLGAYTGQIEEENYALQARLALEQAVLDALDAPVLVADAHCRLLRCNPAAAQLFDLPQSLPDDPLLCATVLTCQRCYGDACLLRPGADPNTPMPPRLFHLAVGCDERTYLLTAHPIRTPAGDLRTLVLLLVNITPQAALIDELTRESVRLR